jgi:hypothetical protein
MEGKALVTSPDGHWWWDGAAWRPLLPRSNREKLVLFAAGSLEAVATAVCYGPTIVVVLMLQARQARKQSLLEARTEPG